MSVGHTHRNSGAPEIAQNDGGEASACTGDHGCCGPKPGLKRRDFIKMAGYGMLAVGAVGPLAVMAGPFASAEAAVMHLVPVDKKLDPA